MNSVIITTCVRDHVLLETSLLTFKTVRKGFPNASILVIDNDSVNSARAIVRREAEAIGAGHVQWQQRREHAEVFSRVIKPHFDPEYMKDGKGSIVFLDSDLIFYENCEGWEFPTALAGRYIPAHTSHYTKSLTSSRLHTSFLWVTPPKLREEIAGYRAGDVMNLEYAPIDFFRPQIIFANDGHPVFHDTCANLYHAVGGTEFSEAQLDAYTHIFCGSSSDIAKKYLPPEVAMGMSTLHHGALSNPDFLKGIWRAQTFET